MFQGMGLLFMDQTPREVQKWWVVEYHSWQETFMAFSCDSLQEAKNYVRDISPPHTQYYVIKEMPSGVYV